MYNLYAEIAMEDNLLDFLFRTIFVIILIAAFTIYINLHTLSSKTLDLLKDDLDDERVVYETNYDVESYTIVGSEIIASIYMGLDVDISIVDDTISSSPIYIYKTDNVNTIDYAVLSTYNKYTVEHIKNNSGIIVRTVYSKLN